MFFLFLLSHDPYPVPGTHLNYFHDDSEVADFLSLATLAVVMGLGSVSAITSASVVFFLLSYDLSPDPGTHLNYSHDDSEAADFLPLSAVYVFCSQLSDARSCDGPGFCVRCLCDLLQNGLS